MARAASAALCLSAPAAVLGGKHFGHDVDLPQLLPPAALGANPQDCWAVRWAHVPVQYWAQFTGDTVQHFCQCSGVAPEQWAQLAVGSVGDVQRGCIATLHPHTFGSMSPAQLRELDGDVAEGLTPHQVAALHPEQCAAFAASSAFKELPCPACQSIDHACLAAVPFKYRERYGQQCGRCAGQRPGAALRGGQKADPSPRQREEAELRRLEAELHKVHQQHQQALTTPFAAAASAADAAKQREQAGVALLLARQEAQLQQQRQQLLQLRQQHEAQEHQQPPHPQQVQQQLPATDAHPAVTPAAHASAAAQQPAVQKLAQAQWPRDIRALEDFIPRSALPPQTPTKQDDINLVRWKAVPPEAVAEMTDEFAKRLTRCADLTATQVGALQPRLFKTLSPACVRSLRPDAFAGVTPEQALFISSQVIGALNARKVSFLTPQACTAFGQSSGFKDIPTDACIGMTPACINAVRPEDHVHITKRCFQPLQHATPAGSQTMRLSRRREQESVKLAAVQQKQVAKAAVGARPLPAADRSGALLAAAAVALAGVAGWGWARVGGTVPQRRDAPRADAEVPMRGGVPAVRYERRTYHGPAERLAPAPTAAYSTL